MAADGGVFSFGDARFCGSTGNGTANAYVRDRTTGTTILVRPGYNGAQPNGDGCRPVISRDGRSVTFESAASNLVAPATCGLVGLGCRGGDQNRVDDVFIYQMATGTVTPVSTASDGAEGNGASNRPTISGDGRKVVFASEATNLVNPATNGTRQVVMRG